MDTLERDKKYLEVFNCGAGEGWKITVGPMV
jgi:hypothetical protein